MGAKGQKERDIANQKCLEKNCGCGCETKNLTEIKYIRSQATFWEIVLAEQIHHSFPKQLHQFIFLYCISQYDWLIVNQSNSVLANFVGVVVVV